MKNMFTTRAIILCILIGASIFSIQSVKTDIATPLTQYGTPKLVLKLRAIELDCIMQPVLSRHARLPVTAKTAARILPACEFFSPLEI